MTNCSQAITLTALPLAAESRSQVQGFPGCFEDAARSGGASQPLSAQASAPHMTAQSSHVPSSELSSFTRVQAASHHARPASIVRLYAAFLACGSLFWSALDGPWDRHFQPSNQQLLHCFEKMRWGAVLTGMPLTLNPDGLAATRLSPLHPLKGVSCSASTNSCNWHGKLSHHTMLGALISLAMAWLSATHLRRGS